MAKPKKIGRPTGRNPVIAVRVEPKLRKEIAADAKAATRTMAAEIDGLLRQALTHRKRLGDTPAGQAIDALILGFRLAGERYAKDNNVTGPWWTDLNSRRAAAVAACVSLITQFVSSDPQQQSDTVSSVKGRIWTRAINRQRGSKEGEP